MANVIPAPDADVPMKFIPAKHRNNNDPTVQYEAGLAAHRSVVEDRDALRAELDAAKIKIKELQTELEVQERDFNLIEKRVNTCIEQRDQAVREAGVLRGMLDAIEAVLAAAKQEPTPSEPIEDDNAGTGTST
jgi:hypothetical protein